MTALPQPAYLPLEVIAEALAIMSEKDIDAFARDLFADLWVRNEDNAAALAVAIADAADIA